MQFTRRRAVLGVLLLAVSAAAAALGYQRLHRSAPTGFPKWDDTSAGRWGDEFVVAQVPSSVAGGPQPAYHLAASSPKPLLVSLHTWSGGYTQPDPLAGLASQAGWNYIHPHLRGPNNTPDACLSDKVVADVDDAIAYAMQHGAVDPRNVFVVGVSGGGYVALGAYLKMRQPVKAILSWAPISDLSAWYYESISRKAKYGADIVKCTNEGSSFDAARARQRSPLHWEVAPRPEIPLEIYAGIDDGYIGSVPVTHSVHFFNRMAAALGQPERQVDHADTLRLLSRGLGTDTLAQAMAPIGGRDVLYRREAGPVSLTIFAGGHEMLPDYTFRRLQEMAGTPAP